MAPKKKKKPEQFEWGKPFLTEGGRVWIHVGYGNWELLPIEDPKVQSTLEYLRSLPDKVVRNYMYRLQNKLDLDKKASAQERSELPPWSKDWKETTNE